MPQKLPASTASFRKIREGNWLYVDKTKYIYEIDNQLYWSQL
ncbi:MAG: AAA family ATPase [Chloroflexota bacterium]